MSMNRPIAWLAAILVIALGQHIAPAQVPTAPGSDHFWQFQPFFDPGYFDQDFQFFAPAEVNDFGGEEHPNVGLYVTFDRTYVNVTRPIDTYSRGSGNQGDFTWGNRIDVGWMNEEDKGWNLNMWHINGPNEKFATAGSVVGLTPAGSTTAQDFVIDQTFDSINVLKMSSFEMNRVWRRPPFHNGTNFEPYLGYRYINVRDFFQRDFMQEVPVGTQPFEYFFIDSFKAIFENQMHGGQLGARIFRQRGHWMLSGEIKFFAFGNFQALRRTREQSFLVNPEDQGQVRVIGPLPLDLSQPTSGGDVNREITHDRATQFVFGGEVKGEAAYELTRDINLRVGFVFFDLGQGIGRGNNMRDNNQAVQMAGVTFGFTYNR
jgi:hypothetical protein